jgi:hypothetical protein
VSKYAKAIIAALIAGLGILGEGLTDGSLSGQEWIAAAVAALVALGGVYLVPNRAAAEKPATGE